MQSHAVKVVLINMHSLNWSPGFAGLGNFHAWPLLRSRPMCVFNLGSLHQPWEEVCWPGQRHEVGAPGVVDGRAAPEGQKTSESKSNPKTVKKRSKDRT